MPDPCQAYQPKTKKQQHYDRGNGPQVSRQEFPGLQSALLTLLVIKILLTPKLKRHPDAVIEMPFLDQFQLPLGLQCLPVVMHYAYDGKLKQQQECQDYEKGEY